MMVWNIVLICNATRQPCRKVFPGQPWETKYISYKICVRMCTCKNITKYYKSARRFRGGKARWDYVGLLWDLAIGLHYAARPGQWKNMEECCLLGDFVRRHSTSGRRLACKAIDRNAIAIVIFHNFPLMVAIGCPAHHDISRIITNHHDSKVRISHARS